MKTVGKTIAVKTRILIDRSDHSLCGDTIVKKCPFLYLAMDRCVLFNRELTLAKGSINRLRRCRPCLKAEEQTK